MLSFSREHGSSFITKQLKISLQNTVASLLQNKSVLLQNVVGITECVNYYKMGLNPLTTNVPYHIETSQLICNTTQLAGFYMMGNIGRYWVKK